MVAYIESRDLVAHRVYFCEDYDGNSGNWVYLGDGRFKKSKEREFADFHKIRYVFHEV